MPCRTVIDHITPPNKRALDDACAAIGEVRRTWTAEPALARSLERATGALIQHGSRAVALLASPLRDEPAIADACDAASRAAHEIADALALIYEERWAQPRSVLAAAAATGHF